MTANGIRYCIDIDGTLCTNTEGEYESAKPFVDAILAVNEFYEQGHYIVLFTARGSGTDIDWREVTIRQMAEWGVKYHELYFGKPAADIYIDDKAINAVSWRSGRFKQTLAAAKQGEESEQ